MAGIGIVLYTVLTGGQPSAVRSAWMGGLGLLAAQIGRRQDGLNSLGLTAAVMAWLESNVLRDIGFQLSFTATLGLILLGNPFTEWTRGTFEKRLPAEWEQRLSQPLVEYFMLTLAAQALSLPVTMYHFQRLSIARLAANFFILPVQPLLMILAGLSLLAGLVVVPIGQFLAYLAWPFAHFTIQAAEFFGDLPGAVLIEINIPTQEALPGQALDLGDGARLEVLFAGPRGATLLLSWKSFRMLLPLGLDAAALDEIDDGKEIGQLSALLLPAAGYAPLNPPGWAQNMMPQVVLLSVSAKDSRGLPDGKTLAAWQGFPLYRTDRNGWIEIQTDGEQMWVEVERK